MRDCIILLEEYHILVFFKRVFVLGESFVHMLRMQKFYVLCLTLCNDCRVWKFKGCCLRNGLAMKESFIITLA